MQPQPQIEIPHRYTVFCASGCRIQRGQPPDRLPGRVPIAGEVSGRAVKLLPLQYHTRQRVLISRYKRITGNERPVAEKRNVARCVAGRVDDTPAGEFINLPVIGDGPDRVAGVSV